MFVTKSYTCIIGFLSYLLQHSKLFISISTDSSPMQTQTWSLTPLFYGGTKPFYSYRRPQTSADSEQGDKKAEIKLVLIREENFASKTFFTLEYYNYSFKVKTTSGGMAQWVKALVLQVWRP